MADPIYLVDQSGEVLEFTDPQQAQYALDGGLAPASPEAAAAFQKRDRLLRENSTLGAQVRGEVEGFGRGLTFGGTDLAARALGADTEAMDVRRELASGVGEFAGAVAPIVASGGTGALGSAARLAPTAVLSGASERAGAAVAKRLFGEVAEAGTLKAMARGAVQGGVTEVIEGVPYGAAELLTEASIGDEELSAEKVAGHLGLSAVLGGALGAGFGAGVAGLGGALKKSGESLGKLRDRAVAAYPSWIAPQVGATPEEVAYLASRRADLKDKPVEEVIQGRYPMPVEPERAIPNLAPLPPEFRPDPSMGRPGMGVPLEGEWAPTPGIAPDPFEKRVRPKGEAPPAFVPDPVPPEALIGDAKPVVLGREAPKAQYVQELRRSIDDAVNDMETLSKRAHNEFRPAQMTPLIDAHTPLEAAQAEAFRLSKAIKEVEQQGVLNGPDRFNPAARAELEKIHAGLVLNIAQPGVTPYRVFQEIDDAKRRLWDEIVGPLSRGAPDVRLRNKETADTVRNLWGEARSITENAALWGEAAAKHAQMNAASHAYMVASANFLPKVTSTFKKGAVQSRRASTKKAESLLRGMTPETLEDMRVWTEAAARYRDVIEEAATATKSDVDRLFGDEALASAAKTIEAEKALKGFKREQSGKAQAAKEAKAAFKEQEAIREANFQREENLRRLRAKREADGFAEAEARRAADDKRAVQSYKATQKAMKEEAEAARAQATAEMEAVSARYRDEMKEYEALVAGREKEIAASAKAMRAAVKWGGIMDIMGGIAVGSNPWVAPFFVGYRAMKYLGSPDKTLRLIADLERYAETISTGIDTAADLLVRGKAAKAGRVVAQLGINHELLSQWSNDPETLVNALNEQTEGINGQMPRLANGVQMATARAAQHLAGKLPKQSDSMYPDPDWEPTDAQMAGFNRALAIADDPTEVLSLASRGELTNADIETMQAIYPALLNDIRVRVIEAMARNPEKPPYKARQQLSRLLGQDVTGAMPTLAANQAAYEANPAPAAPAPPRSSTERSTRMMTPLQQAEAP